MTASQTILNQRYLLEGQLGSGGMAVVFRALDQDLERPVAIKILRPDKAPDQSWVKSFRNEALSVARLSHPNIVTVHDIGADGQRQYMVMEYVEGENLKEILRREGALPVDRAVGLAIQICAGIGYAHRAGIVHADVKPQNILVTRDWRVKVADFGIAQALGDTRLAQQQEVVWGSPHYFSPEQAQGARPTAASDVYAIGVVLFEMLCGEQPYSDAEPQQLARAHVEERVPHVIEREPNVPENLSKLVHKLMQKDPAARFRMADQPGKILAAWRAQSGARTSKAGARHALQSAPVARQARASVPPRAPRISQEMLAKSGGGGMDAVTIALGLIALISVAGLIPLYALVIRAWGGS